MNIHEENNIYEKISDLENENKLLREAWDKVKSEITSLQDIIDPNKASNIDPDTYWGAACVACLKIIDKNLTKEVKDIIEYPIEFEFDSETSETGAVVKGRTIKEVNLEITNMKKHISNFDFD